MTYNEDNVKQIDCCLYLACRGIVFGVCFIAKFFMQIFAFGNDILKEKNPTKENLTCIHSNTLVG